ncbi:MAG: hypothetical protein IJ644_05120 [Oscillospiraceae bacterium]|nr:hypothetical protein [Oscillospiraceae bacterium]
MKYEGNAIYEYIRSHGLHQYCFLVKQQWVLLYGDMQGIPRLLAFVSETDALDSAFSPEERQNGNRICKIARQLNLPFVAVRFVPNSQNISVWLNQKWQSMTYQNLKQVYEKFGIVQSGKAGKDVNQYTSSGYHDWQRAELGRITVTDLDLIKIQNDDSIASIIELKRSKIPVASWNPYRNDYPNFALTINAIVNSGKKIPFRLYYNIMYDGTAGHRTEDISEIKVFEFQIPDNMITANEVHHQYIGTFSPDKLL